MESALNNGMCRCCASEGTFKDVKSTYHWMGDTEVYSDMLRECFDIDLYLTEDGDDGGICEVCITQLRNASNFKKQVQYTELQFKKRLEEPMFKSDIIKIEPSKEDELESDNDDHNASHMSDASTEFGVPIKMEELEEIKPKKRAAKASTSRAKKSKVEAGESSSKRVVPAVKERRGCANIPPAMFDSNNIDSKVQPITQMNEQTNSEDVPVKRKLMLTISPLTIRSEQQREIKLCWVKKPRLDTENTLLKKHRNNIKVILECSNATVFNGHSDLGFVCYYCDEKYPDPADLKQHTLTTHFDIKEAKFMNEFTKNVKLLLKLDITGLFCRLCLMQIENLEELKEHLTKKHAKTIHTDIKNQFIPFKFRDKQIECFMCSAQFLRFRLLVNHMGKHYPNFVCDVCNNGYVTQSSLNLHLKTHQTGTFKCDDCDKVFSTLVKQKFHMKDVHRGSLRNRCGHCGANFRCLTQKTRHLIDAHGISVPEYSCKACGTNFISSKALRIHERKDHLVERDHKCTQCDKAFFTAGQLKLHIVKHTGERNFQCEVCLKTYGRKKTLTEHMKIHADDRRFKCEHCGQAFVQNCSLKNHLRTKHKEII